MSIDTVDGFLNTFLAVYTGSALTNLTLIAKDGTGIGPSKLTMDAQRGIDYHIAVDSSNGTTGRSVLHIVVQEIHINSMFVSGINRGFDLSGPSGGDFLVETSTNLVNWNIARRTNFLSTGFSTFTFLKPIGREGYYRVSTP